MELWIEETNPLSFAKVVRRNPCKAIKAAKPSIMAKMNLPIICVKSLLVQTKLYKKYVLKGLNLEACTAILDLTIACPELRKYINHSWSTNQKVAKRTYQKTGFKIFKK